MTLTRATCPHCRTAIPLGEAKSGWPTHCPVCKVLLAGMDEASAEPLWFYAVNRQKNGPVSRSQLQQLAKAGRLRPGDMLLPAGTAKWVMAATVTGLFASPDLMKNDPAAPLETPAVASSPTEAFQALAGASPRLRPGSTGTLLPSIPGYEILSELGRGGMGVVYNARHLRLKRLVALKMILTGVHAGSLELARFRTEAEALAQLQHPNIVQIYEVGEVEGRPYFALELVEGGSLDRQIDGKPMPPTDAAQLTELLARAVEHAHQHGIVHRDLKPANVLLQAHGEPPVGLDCPKITDFGLAKHLDAASLQTQSGAIVGTPSYAAPEQAAGKIREIGPATDIYALGAILYELLTGRPPFLGESPLDTVLQVLSQEPKPPRSLNPGVPSDLETICLKCLEKQPARRYGSALALADDLRHFLNGEPVVARPLGQVEIMWRWARRNPLPAAMLIVVSLLLVVVTLGSTFGLWHLSSLSEELVRSTAIESAAQESEMLEALNTFYSKEVVDRVRPYGIEITHNYTSKNGAIPLPATMTIDLGNHISEKSERGMLVRLYSDYPFKSRKDGGPKDSFEWEALGKLRLNPTEPVVRFEEFQGRVSLRYATARVMKDSCVKCHNTHPESTKTNWHAGEVRGVLEIVRPLDQDVRRTRDGLRGTFRLMATVASLLFVSLTAGVCLAGLWCRRYAQLGGNLTEKNG